MPIPIGKDGCYDLENATFEQIRNEFSGIVLEQFVKNGGDGLRSALWELMCVTLDWRKAQDQKKKDK